MNRIIAGLQDAVAHAKGDETAAHLCWPADLAEREAEAGDLLDGCREQEWLIADEAAHGWREWAAVTAGWICLGIFAVAIVAVAYGVLNWVFK